MVATNLILIIGGSGTGKTTLARALQERLLPEQWFHFSPDTFLYCLPASIVRRADLANDWAAVDTTLISELAHGCVRNTLGSGARVVFDCVVMSERRARQLVAAFANSEPFVVGTTCDWDELVRRTEVRGDRTLEEVRRGFETGGQLLELDCVLDTTAAPPERLAHQVVEQLERRIDACAWRRNVARYQGEGDGPSLPRPKSWQRPLA